MTAANEPNVGVRLGAIYALERIAFDSPRDHWPIMEVLTAYVRQNAPAPVRDTTKENEEPKKKITKKPATEIQAILTVLKRRKRGHKREGKGQRLDLRNSNLRGATFHGVHLEGASFDGSHLQGVCFNGAHLDEAWFDGSRLQGAFFSGSHLDGAWFSGAHLDGAYFYQAHLDGASFEEAHLDGASFEEAHLDRASFEEAHLDSARFKDAHLDGAWFIGAHLAGAMFSGANLDGAVFDESNLAGVDFRGALDLTVGQFEISVGVEQALFDEAFRRELEAAKEAANKSAAGNGDTKQT